MGTLGPTGTTTDNSSFTNFASWAGTGTFGINKALSNFGWTRTTDGNQIQWAAPPTAAPVAFTAGATYPPTNFPTGNYFINTRGNWVSGTNYAVGDVVFDTTTQSSYYTFLAINNSTTVPSSDTTHFFVYHYEIWQTNDTATYNVTAVSRTAGGLATFTCNNGGANGARLKAGFVVVVSGLTNVPTLNGTWTIFSATTTNFTVQTGGGLIGTTSDSGTAVYTLQTICMKLEYLGNSSAYSVEPWIRLSFGTSTDTFGNLINNVVGSTNAGSSLSTGNNFGFCVIDLVPNSADASGAQTSSIWRCIASGANSRFGTSLWYNRNDTNATNRGSVAWVVERGKDDAGNEIDDYFTYVALCNSTIGVFSSTVRFIQQRSILKWNPIVNSSTVTIDGSNNLTITYPANTGYTFAIGATVFLSGFTEAPFLNGQFVTVTGVGANSITVAGFIHAAYATAPDTGNLRLSTSNTTFTPIAGTGLPCMSDPRPCTIHTSFGSLTFNGNTPLLPVFPIPGFLGNPMTMCQSLRSGDQPLHDTTAVITLYGLSRTYYFNQGTTQTDPYIRFGGDGSVNNGFALRWD